MLSSHEKQYHINVSSENVGRYCIIPGDPGRCQVIASYLDNPKFDKYLEYRRGKKIEIDAPEGFIYSFDGELIRQNHFTVEVVPNAIRFAVPKSAVYLPGEKHVPKYAAEKEIINAP